MEMEIPGENLQGLHNIILKRTNKIEFSLCRKERFVHTIGHYESNAFRSLDCDNFNSSSFGSNLKKLT